MLVLVDVFCVGWGQWRDVEVRVVGVEWAVWYCFQEFLEFMSGVLVVHCGRVG